MGIVASSFFAPLSTGNGITRREPARYGLPNRDYRAWLGPLPLPVGTPGPLSPRSPSESTAYSVCGWGHGGTRNSSTSRRIQTWSVNPAAIAGARGCHRLAELRPLVGRGCAKASRKLV
jgi:hypothetical protein